MPHNVYRSTGAYLPGNVKLIVTNEVGVVALERVKDERLVSLGDVHVRESPLVRQVHLGGDRTCVKTRQLRVQLQVHGLRGLNTDDEFVARDVLEDALRDILELNPDLHLGLVEG